MEDYKYVVIEKYNLPNFPQNYNAVVPYKQHEQGHQDPYPVCVLERTTAFAQFQILLVQDTLLVTLSRPRITFSTLSLERPINTHLRNNSCGNIGETRSKKGLLICSHNDPSILKHKDEIEILIKENKIDILAINETKLDNRIKNDTVAVDGYIVKRFDRNRHGSGVALYIGETLDFELRDDIPKGNMESICIQVKPKCGKSFFN